MYKHGVVLLILVACCSACDVIQISFDLCNTDVFCQNSMYIDENGADLITFEFLYERLLGNTTYQSTFEDMLCNETTGNVTAPSAFEKLWITTMSKYRYCNHINQYFDGYIKKCVCKTDKICKYTSANDEEFHFTNSSLFFVIILLTIAFTVIFFNHRNRSVYNLLSEFKELLLTGRATFV